MDLAVVGCGAVAERYAPPLDECGSLDLVGAVDVVPQRADSFASIHGCPAFSDLDALLSDADPSLVVNLTSHAAHAEVTRTCLSAGRHVYSEKPLALDAGEARDLIETAERRGLGLGCAPIAPDCDRQRLVGRLLEDGRTGHVAVAYAAAHVGRVTDWHDRPDSFLRVGPLYDGAVYPLSVLVSWFGPVERIRTADALTRYPDADPDRPTHVLASLQFADGPVVRLTASTYVPHRSREFYGLELHGDDASIYLADAGDRGGGREPLVSVAGRGREYTGTPPGRPSRERPYLDGVLALAEAIESGRPATRTARRAAHVVAVCNAVERAAEEGGPVAVDDCGVTVERPPAPVVGPAPTRGDVAAPTRGDVAGSTGGTDVPPADAALRLPRVGFGCSRYRDGDYVDRIESIEWALDAGYRLFDSAELYGNERRIGEVLAAPGTPDRETLFLVSKAWNTNHGHLREACEGTLSRLGVDALDCYMLHWPESWAYTGPLGELADLPPDEQEALTFPRDDGEVRPGGVPLGAAWADMESLHDAGLARSLGICNVDRATLADLCSDARIPPAVVQVGCDPYEPRGDLVEFCHARGIRMLAHSPLSTDGLLDEPVLADVAAAHDASPAAVVLAWLVDRGVVPIPSSIKREHVVENRAAAGIELAVDERRRIASLAGEGPERD